MDTRTANAIAYTDRGLSTDLLCKSVDNSESAHVRELANQIRNGGVVIKAGTGNEETGNEEMWKCVNEEMWK